MKSFTFRSPQSYTYHHRINYHFLSEPCRRKSCSLLEYELFGLMHCMGNRVFLIFILLRQPFQPSACAAGEIANAARARSARRNTDLAAQEQVTENLLLHTKTKYSESYQPDYITSLGKGFCQLVIVSKSRAYNDGRFGSLLF